LDKQLELLTKLQTIDSEIDQLEQRKQQIPDEIIALEEGLVLFGKELEELKEHIEQINKLRRKKEGEAERERESLKKSQAKLREVKTNKEYSAMLKEIELLKQKILSSEDEVLSYMIKLEEENEKLKNKEREFQQKQSNVLKEKKRKQEEISKLNQVLADKVKAKGEIICCLDERTYQNYLRLREIRKGIAVVKVKDGICQGCYMVLPPQTFNEVKKNSQIITCTHCSRILFWADS
jgi:hypothetical protein